LKKKYYIDFGSTPALVVIVFCDNILITAIIIINELTRRCESPEHQKRWGATINWRTQPRSGATGNGACEL